MTLYQVQWSARTQAHTQTGTINVMGHDACHAAINARLAVWKYHLRGWQFANIIALNVTPISNDVA